MKGLYLPEKQAYQVISHQKRLLVKSSQVSGILGEPIFLLAKDKVYGKIIIKNEQVKKKRELYKMTSSHGMTKEDIDKNWKDLKELYIYDIDVIDSFKPSLVWKRIDSPNSIVDNVEIEKSVFIKFPLEKVKQEFVSGLSDIEKEILNKKIEQLITIFPEDNTIKQTQERIFSKVKQDIRRRFAMQIKFSGLDKGELDYDYKTLLIKYPKTLYSIRLSINDESLHTIYIDPQKEGRVKKYDVEFEEGASNVWMDIAMRDNFVANNGANYIKVFNLDFGEMSYRIINKSIYEIDFNGAMLKGKHVISKRKDQKNWTFEKIDE